MTGWDADHRHLPALPDARHDPRTADEFRVALWRATDATLAEDERRHGPGRVDRTRHRMRLTDDLPSRYDRVNGRRGDPDTTRAPRDPDAVVLGANEAVVAETLRAAGCPLTRGEVESRSGLTFAQVRRSLGHLRDAGRVAMTGWGGGTGRGNYARWRLCEPSPTPGPSPTPSANAGTTK